MTRLKLGTAIGLGISFAALMSGSAPAQDARQDAVEPPLSWVRQG